MQPTVSLSTTKVEYRTPTNASRDLIYFKRLLSELGFESTDPTSILSDNESCTKLVENPILHLRTKHVGLQYHFIREASRAGEVQVDYVPTKFQQANFFIKSLPLSLFAADRNSVVILQIPTTN
jgi:hypothetical protein